VEVVPWNHYSPSRGDDVAIVRTTWDYTARREEFLRKMEEISRSPTRLLNPYEILRWNSHKSYLLELEAKGVPIVPTRLLRAGDSLAEVEAGIAQWKASEWIFKPAVSATSEGLIRVKRYQLSAALLESQASGRDFLIQPFLPEILQGEVSHVFFGKRFSHAVIKRPQGGDFRVQDAYGGKSFAHAATADEVEFCGNVLRCIPDPLLLARVDFVRTAEGPKLMELELVEPLLFFGLAAEVAPRRFMDALTQYQSAPTE
jgi:glutathione synthase/RimK-type ligase-like ATP-grasp enzyme